MAVELNVDLGELPDEPEALYALATVANVACGGHAGDEATMRRATLRAAASGTRLAAHPSYPDREGFGRRTIAMRPAELYESVVEQCVALARVAAERGLEVRLVKPHGALYHDAAKDPVVAAALLDGALSALPDGPAIVGPPAGALADGARARGLAYVREGFADRRYDDAGGLVPRSRPDALLAEPAAAAEQALRLARAGACETICVHGDSPGAVAIARAVRDALDGAGLLARGAPR